MRAAQPGLEGGARVRVPVGTAAWDELTSACACARAEIWTRGPGGQLQPDPSQRRGNPVSAKNLPTATRSTRSRHLPQLPARHRPRLRSRLLGGGVPGRSSFSWAGHETKSLVGRFQGIPPLYGRHSRGTVASGGRGYGLPYPVGGAVSVGSSGWAGPGILSPRLRGAQTGPALAANLNCGMSCLPRESATCSTDRSARREFTV